MIVLRGFYSVIEAAKDCRYTNMDDLLLLEEMIFPWTPKEYTHWSHN